MASNDENFVLDSSHNPQDVGNIPSFIPFNSPETGESPGSVAYPDLNGFQASPNHKLRVTRPIDTPVSFTPNKFRNDNKYVTAEDKYPVIAREVKTWAVGPMPEQPFLDHFLPYNTNTGPAPVMQPSSPSHRPMSSGSTQEAFKTPSAFDSIKFPVKTEQELYDPIVSTQRYINFH